MEIATIVGSKGSFTSVRNTKKAGSPAEAWKNYVVHAPIVRRARQLPEMVGKALSGS